VKRSKAPPAFSFDAFIRSLGAEVKKPPVVESVQRALALSPAPDLAAFLARYSAPGKKLKRDELGVWSIGFEPWSAKSWAKTVKGRLPWAWTEGVPAFTGTVEVGRDGSGDVYLAEVHPQRSTVFKLEKSTGLVHYLAESFTVFAELSHVMHELDAYVEAHELDPEEISKKQVAASATLRALSIQAAALAGKIDLRECAEYAELLAPLVSKRFTSKTKSLVAKLAERAHWFKLVAIHGGDLAKAQAKRPPPLPKELLGLAPARVQRLVEAAVFAPKELASLAQQAKSDEAEVVRELARALPAFEGFSSRGK
jgi:hypothetical protein